MSSFATWVVLGFVLLQLGVERQTLMSERFYRMDRSAGQSPVDEWYVQMTEPTGKGAQQIAVFTNSDRVSAIVVTTGRL
jgi:hypothetical protein